MTHDPDVLIVTETWLSSHIQDNELDIPNYLVIRKDRQSRGGGIAILYKTCFKATPMPDVTGIESLWCRLWFNDFTLYVGAAYRPPNETADFFDILYKYMQSNVQPNDKIILAGDFNLPEITWPEPQDPLACLDGTNPMCDICFSYELTQIVSDFTRTQASSQSVLDLIFVSGYFLKELDVNIVDGISDHDIVVASLRLDTVPKNTSKVIQVLDLNRANDVAILDCFDFHFDPFYELSLRSDSSTNDLWNSFKSIISHCMNTYIPTKIKRTAKRNPWITREIIHTKRKINRLQKQTKITKNASKKEQITNLTKELGSKIKCAKKKFYNETLYSFIRTAPDKFWRYINPRAKGKNDTEIANSPDKANNFNDYFLSVFTRDNGVMPPYMNRQLQDTVGNITISEAGILCLLLNLDPKKSAGPDNITNAFLIRYAEWVSKYLSLIYRKSLQESKIPPDWKQAKVIPIHKSGSRESI